MPDELNVFQDGRTDAPPRLIGLMSNFDSQTKHMEAEGRVHRRLH